MKKCDPGEKSWITLTWRSHFFYVSPCCSRRLLFDHLHKRFPAFKALSVVSFPFQDSPESFHWTVVDAFCHPGHTLRHPGIYQLFVECTVGVWIYVVTMEQRMGIRVFLNGCIECIEHQGLSL